MQLLKQLLSPNSSLNNITIVESVHDVDDIGSSSLETILVSIWKQSKITRWIQYDTEFPSKNHCYCYGFKTCKTTFVLGSFTLIDCNQSIFNVVHYNIIMQAYKLGIKYPKYVFLTYGSYESRWWSSDEVSDECSPEEIAEVLQFFLAALYFPSLSTHATDAGIVKTSSKYILYLSIIIIFSLYRTFKWMIIIATSWLLTSIISAMMPLWY